MLQQHINGKRYSGSGDKTHGDWVGVGADASRVGVHCLAAGVDLLGVHAVLGVQVLHLQDNATLSIGAACRPHERRISAHQPFGFTVMEQLQLRNT